MNTKQEIERAKELLSFDSDLGEFRWRTTIGSRAKKGDVAGSSGAKGYRLLRIDGRLYLAHRLAWAMHYGEWPAGLVVHLNQDRSDNRIENLGIASKPDAHAHTRSVAINAQNVHSIFKYEDGILLWRSGLSGKSRIAGSAAGTLGANGYVVIETGGKAIGAHRIVWLMHHGEWPTGEIDHLNCVRNDNRIENLRDVARITNTENRRKASVKSMAGLLGVESMKSGKFRARIRSSGRLHNLGTFSDPESAHAAYVQAKRRLHKGNTI